MHAHDGAHVAGQVAAARRARQVLRRVQTVRVQHEVPVYTSQLLTRLKQNKAFL